MSDEPELTPDQERSMWMRLASSPYITDEERRDFAIRAAEVANTARLNDASLNAAIQRELDARRSGAQLVTTLPPMVAQQRLDREEWEQLTARRPPGECVAHSVNAAAHITAAAAPLTIWGMFITAVPDFQFRAVSWDRLPPPQKANANVTELCKLLGQIFSGGVTAISFSQSAESSRAKLNFEISLPADITYDDVLANLQRLAGEHSSAKAAPNTGRRRLLKLEETAG